MRSKLAAVAVIVLFAGVVWAASPMPPASERVPSAILGEGAPPTGKDLRYVPDDPATVSEVHGGRTGPGLTASARPRILRLRRRIPIERGGVS